jgi:hypothetical protein
MDRLLVGREYASHLTDADLRLLASVAGAAAGTGQLSEAGDPADAPGLRGDPEALLRLLEHPGVFRAVLGPADAAQGWAVPASPFLVFAAFVQQATAELAAMDHVPERTGPRQRVPLFDAPALRDFLGEPPRRLFLAELLASFTHVASGRYRVRAGGRTRTRRFSELDPVRLAGLLDAVAPAERPGVYRRLGDVTLFLAGVFPDYATTMELWEYLGARWYRAARDRAPATTARLGVAGDVALVRAAQFLTTARGQLASGDSGTASAATPDSARAAASVSLT